MRRSCLVTTAAFVLTLSGVEKVWADAIIISELRFTLAQASASKPGFASDHSEDATNASTNIFIDTSAALAVSGTSASTASATQDSLLSSTLFTGALTAFHQSFVEPFGDGIASSVGQSYYQVDFELVTPHTYVLEGLLARGGTRTQVEMEGIFLATDSGPFADSGLLGPGVYRLIAEALSVTPSVTGTGSGNASAQFSLRLTDTAVPVPEPASLTLLLMGMAAAVAANRRRSTDASPRAIRHLA